MELKTDSGVSITIIEAGSSRVIVFDKSVRAVELNEEEISKISASLSAKLENSDSKPKVKRKQTKVENKPDSKEVS
jgi:hypothetical protein